MHNLPQRHQLFHTQSAQIPFYIHAQSTQTKHVGAVPACPPERPRSGVSIPKIHALCAGDERWMRPCRATRAGTQAPPLPRSVIFFHTIPYKQNNHLRAIPHKPNNHLHAIPKRYQPFARNLPKRNRRGGAYVPARTSA